jgi:DNA-binding NarL/FixJ family response regulator
LASWLTSYEDIRVVAVGSTVHQNRDVETDVTVVGLAGLDIDAATRAIARVRGHSDAKLVALLDGAEDVLAWVVDARVDACLDIETADARELVETVRSVVDGRTVISTGLLSAPHERRDALVPGTTLTPRERDVLALLSEGRSNKSIANQLELKVGTVSVYVSVILAKLGAANRTEAAMTALRLGLLASGRGDHQRARHPSGTGRVGVPAGRARPSRPPAGASATPARSILETRLRQSMV